MSLTGWSRNSNEVSDAEVPAAAAERPEQVVVLLLAGDDEPARRRSRRRRTSGCRRRGRTRARGSRCRRPASARHAGGRDDAAGGGQPEGIRRGVEVTPRGAALGAGRPLRRVDPHPAHAERSMTTAVVASPEPGTLWPPPRTARSSPSPGEVDGRHHVAGVGGSHRRPRRAAGRSWRCRPCGPRRRRRRGR